MYFDELFLYRLANLNNIKNSYPRVKNIGFQLSIAYLCPTNFQTLN